MVCLIANSYLQANLWNMNNFYFLDPLKRVKFFQSKLHVAARMPQQLYGNDRHRNNL